MVIFPLPFQFSKKGHPRKTFLKTFVLGLAPGDLPSSIKLRSVANPQTLGRPRQKSGAKTCQSFRCWWFFFPTHLKHMRKVNLDHETPRIRDLK